MAEIEETPQQASPASEKCMVCGKPEYEEGYVNKMCADCRTKHSQLSVPLWVKLFATGILLLVLIDIPRFQKYFVVGIHYARGEKAQDSNKYFTAEKEFSRIADVLPECTLNNLRLIVCCERNSDIDGFNDVLHRTAGLETDERDLLYDANNSIKIMNQFSPVQELDTLMRQIGNASPMIFLDSLRAYSLHSGDDLARYLLANKYFDLGKFTSSDSLMSLVLFGESENMAFLSLKAAIKREQGNYDSSIYYYDKMLERNSESLIALDGKARVELKRKHDGDALKYAAMAYSLDSTNSASLEAMILTRYFENRKPESDHLLAEWKILHPADSDMIARTQNVIEGKTIYR